MERLLPRAEVAGFERAHGEWEVALTAAVVGLVGQHPDADPARSVAVLRERCLAEEGHGQVVDGAAACRPVRIPPTSARVRATRWQRALLAVTSTALLIRSRHR